MQKQTQHLGKRRSARVILLNQFDQVLLIRFSILREGKVFQFWATPGGSVESGETDQDAAQRELLEELGLDLPLSGPVHTATDTFDHKGELVMNTDVFFVGRCDQEAPKLDAKTEDERAAMKEFRWWSVGDIEESAKRIFPEGISELVRRHL